MNEMKTRIEKVVLNCYKRILQELESDALPCLDAKIGSRGSGLDSLGVVSLIVEIEEELEMNLDSILVSLRQSEKLVDIIPLLEALVEEKSCG
ncbi:hypothetical protein [Paenibacillus wynnii]|uniref:Carrier domain-containing protein n=1 Tax=Paenibacillus wynnii TaxID=268407 RepID=A0A098MB24_9BACL|nr:hypothetical protein [Paenibacillus wynnii]KGE19745.1 hypothetical protein PWYN_10640 [Paenibacillus wynnii]